MGSYELFWNGHRFVEGTTADLVGIRPDEVERLFIIDLETDLAAYKPPSQGVDGVNNVSISGDMAWKDYNGTLVTAGGKTFYNPNTLENKLYFYATPKAVDLGNNKTLYFGWKNYGAIFVENNIRIYFKVEYSTDVTVQWWAGESSDSYITKGQSSFSPAFEVPSRPGYTLEGVYTSSAGGIKVLDGNCMPLASVSGYTDSTKKWICTDSSLTLYARWTEDTYSVSKTAVNVTSSAISRSTNIRYASDSVSLTWVRPSAVTGKTVKFVEASFQYQSGGYVSIKKITTEDNHLDFNYASDSGGHWYGSSLRAFVRYAMTVPVQLISGDSSKGTVGPSESSQWNSYEEEVDTTSGYNSYQIVAVPKPGYNFQQWSDGSTSAKRTLTVTQAVTLTAYFTEAQYKITVKAGTNGSILVPSSGNVQGVTGGQASIQAQGNSGYSFEKWTKSTGATVEIADETSASTMITIGTSNDTITANFVKTKTDIVLDRNAYDGTDGTGTIEGNATALKVSASPTREQSAMWTLKEFHLNSSLTQRIAYKSSSTWRLDADVYYGGVQYTDASGRWQLGTGTETFYAVWQGKELTVTFNPNGGTVSPTSKKVNYGSDYGELPTPTNSDTSLTFIGWYTEQEGGLQIKENTAVEQTANHTLYAHWSTGIILSFDPTGGYVEETMKLVHYGQSVGVLPTPNRSGWTFGGWYTQATGGTRVRSNTTCTFTVNTTLYAHWSKFNINYSVSYNAQGGSPTPSTQTAVSQEESYTFTVSSTSPTKDGYQFLGWATSSGSAAPQYLPNGKITVRYDSETGTSSVTLYAVWTAIQPIEGEMVDKVWIYKADATGKAPGTAYIEVSDRLAQRSVINETENYGMTAQFTIVNGVGSDNLLSSSHAWSTGTGALDVGQFVRIRHGSAVGMQWGWFFITSLNVSDDLITVVCGDYIQWLRANGGEYYRNHYDPNGYEQLWKGVHWNNDMLYMDKPSAVTPVGGAAGDVKIMVPSTMTAGSTSTEQIQIYTRSIWSYIPIRDAPITKKAVDDKAIALTSISVVLKNTGPVWGVRAYYDDNRDLLIASGSPSGTIGQEFTRVTLTLPQIKHINCKGITIEVYAGGSSIAGGVYNRIGSCIGGHTRYYDVNGNIQERADMSLDVELGILVYDNASGEAITGQPTKWKITSVASGATIDTSLGTAVVDSSGDSVERGWIEYLDPASGVSIAEVVSNICGAAGCTVAIGTMQRSVNMFRCAGSYYHDYLLALGDMTEDPSSDYNDRRHSFCCSQTSWASLMFGLRRLESDPSAMTLYYGGDSSPSSGAIPMMTFEPRKTMQYRPCKAISKGLDNDGNPIIVCLKDPNIKLGSSAIGLESTDTSSAQAALNAYNTIMTNKSNLWEGEVVIDGIHPEVMSRLGTILGGIAVSIYDSRYAMSGMKARVKEAVYDYQNLTTKLVLNNYTEVYSNSISDTSKMAYNAGNMSLAVSGEDMYLRQFVYLDVTGSLSVNPSGTHSMTIHVLGSPGGTQTVTPEVISFPEMGYCLLVGFFPVGSAYSDDTQYAVDTVTVDGTAISINQYFRPDKRDEQYVIVNVQASLP